MPEWWANIDVARLFDSSELIGSRGAPEGMLSFEAFRSLAACRTFTDAELRYAFDEADIDHNQLLSVGEVERVIVQLQKDQVQEVSSARGGPGFLMQQLEVLRNGVARTARQCRLATQLIFAPAQEWSSEKRHPHLVKQATVDLGKAVPLVGAALFLPGASLALPAIAALFPKAVPSNFRALVPTAQAEAKRPAAQPDEFDRLTRSVFSLVLERLQASAASAAAPPQVSTVESASSE